MIPAINNVETDTEILSIGEKQLRRYEKSRKNVHDLEFEDQQRMYQYSPAVVLLYYILLYIVFLGINNVKIDTEIFPIAYRLDGDIKVHAK